VPKRFQDDDLHELQKLSRELNYEVKKPGIAIAFPLFNQSDQENNDVDSIVSNFYCYLPTEDKCGFNILVHADFLLDVSRKHVDLQSNPYNERLLEHIIEFISVY